MTPNCSACRQRKRWTITGAILARLRYESPDTVIYIQSLLPTQAPKFIAWSDAVNRKAELLADGKRSYFLSIRGHFLKDGLLDPVLASDGLHLNGVGYLTWRSAILPVLELYKRP